MLKYSLAFFKAVLSKTTSPKDLQMSNMIVADHAAGSWISVTDLVLI